MPRRRYLPALALPVFLLVDGCYYDVEEELYPDTICDTTGVTFSGTIQPLMQSYCAVPTCHVTVGGNGMGDLSDHAGVMLKVDDGSFADRLFVQRDMPPAGNTQLRACDLEKIQVWLNAGAPNN